jgi:hypothetical protein
VVCQFCQDQDHDPQGTKEKLREYNGAKTGGSFSHSYACRAFGLITVVVFLVFLLTARAVRVSLFVLFVADAAAGAAGTQVR